ncbi:lipocalin family protein [Pedobacter helvus]|uniref:Lipocalin family protein n=1 Tax=Pedobacter helvus TaxID=2563444 RepID=A0ABW9JJT3_9SPHI|nr:lipocalin family protein [Pedobacter ureilyticus]
MKDIKNTFWLILLATTAILSSCKKKDATIEEPEIYTESQVIGQWIYDKIKINGVLQNYEHTEKCGKDSFFFRNRPGQDHQYEEVVYITPTGNCAISQTFMEWKIKGRKLILNFGQQVFTYQIIKLDDISFEVSIKIDYDGDGKLDELELHAIRKPCTDWDHRCQTP